MASARNRVSSLAETPPTYTIDLSQPPAERYVTVAREFKDRIHDLPILFDEVVSGLSTVSVGTAKWWAKLLLRRLHSSEQTEELRGISKATAIDMYLLVAFNTLLDLFMGCTSGGVRVKGGTTAKMLHFRTLDWGMDPLRKIIVQFEFVDYAGGPVIARSVTYVGFVGVLTGVRQNLSLSLNFRPHHDSSARFANLRFYGHHVLILLGMRPSISSKLREYLLPQYKRSKLGKAYTRISTNGLPSLSSITHDLPGFTSTAAYIIASDGITTTVFEKDRATSTIRSSESFIVITNHDLTHETSQADQERSPQDHLNIPGLQELLEESVERKGCMEKNWRRACRKHRRNNTSDTEDDVCTVQSEVEKWLIEYPVTNETTHFATIMDAKEGQIVWLKKWNVPIRPASLQ